MTVVTVLISRVYVAVPVRTRELYPESFCIAMTVRGGAKLNSFPAPSLIITPRLRTVLIKPPLVYSKEVKPRLLRTVGSI